MDNTTWHDMKPSHKPIPKAVVVANEHAIIAREVYDDYINEMLNSGIPGIEWTEVDYLARRANDAEDRAEQARHDALNDGPLEETTEVVMVEDETDIPFGYRVPRKGE